MEPELSDVANGLVFTLRAALTGCQGGLFVGNPCFSSSGRTGRQDPQPDTNPSQLWLAVKCGRLCVEPRKEAESQKAPLEGGLGGEP